MKTQDDPTANILNDHISGFHQYDLRDPVHLTFVSRHFCRMIGYSEEELLSDTADLWATKVHPGDRKIYEEALRRLKEGEPEVTVQYRITAKDGGVRFVSDSLSSGTGEDGSPIACSVLTDITPVWTEMENLRFLNETAPFGILRYTCEKKPKITYINDSLLRMLRFFPARDGGFDDFDLYNENLYLLISPEHREGFAGVLKGVAEKAAPAAGEVNVLRRDGTKGRLFGWVTKCGNEQGDEEFQSVCMDVTEQYKERKERRTKQYRRALADVYDKVFEYDFVNQTVKYIYGSDSDTFGKIQNVPMDLEKATEQWIHHAVIPEDREGVEKFFQRMRRSSADAFEGRPPQLRFRLLSSDGEIQAYTGVFLRIDAVVSFFCCRRGAADDDALRNENLSLRHINENMQELVMQFTDGIVAFKVENDKVRPLYASDNLCDFFGYTKDEWLTLARENHSIKDFVSKSGVAYEDIQKLLENGEAEFVYNDLKSGRKRCIKAICSRNADDAEGPCYVLLSHTNEEDAAKGKYGVEEEKIYIRTFGYFDVFVEGNPIAFRNKKSKELFALLVDRRGGYVSSDEAISFLWEEESVNSVTLARYRKVALRLKNILEEYGIADIVESVDGKRRIVTEKVRCDLYDYLSRKDEFAQLFKGSYLTNYSWGEMTLGELLNG